MILGIDVSTHLEELSLGVKYYDEGREVAPLTHFLQKKFKGFRLLPTFDEYKL